MAWSREGFWKLLKAEPRTAPALLSRDIEDRAGYCVERLLFEFGDAGPVRGILTRPTTASGRAPALLYMHAHGGRFDIGANEILDGQPATLSPLGPVFAGAGYVTPMLAHLCCFADYGVMIDLGLHDRHGHYLTIPGMLAQTSVGEIGGAIAPRSQLICIGEADTLTPPAAFRKAYGEAEAAYKAAGAPSALRLISEPGVGHAETPGMRDGVLRFFRETL